MNMYFIIIVGVLAFNMAISITTLVLVARRGAPGRTDAKAAPAPPPKGADPAGGGVVFCRVCHKQYDSTLAACPECRGRG